MPSRFKFGDAEIEIGGLQEIAEELVEVTPVAEGDQLLQRLTDLNRAIPDAATPAIEGLFYQQVVVEMLRDIRGDVSIDLEAGDRRWDVIARSPGGAGVVVDIVTSASRATHHIRSAIRAFEVDHQVLRANKLLLVVRTKPSVTVLEEVNRLPNVAVVVVTDHTDRSLLIREVRNLLEGQS